MSEFLENDTADLSDREIQEEQLDELRRIRIKVSGVHSILVFYLLCSLLYAMYLWSLMP